MAQTATSSKKTSVQDAALRVCPFCGTINDDRRTCARCTLEDCPTMRAATKARIGPWYVLQTRNPAAPGMKFDTLGVLIRRGLVTAQSVVRGPTTHQLWNWAAKVKGLSREFNLCYSCGEPIEKTDALCGHCNRSQLPPADVDGLLDVSTPTPASGAVDEKTDPKAVSQPAAINDAIGVEQADILSLRELAMVFQLDYGPPLETAQTAPEHNRTKWVVAAVLLLISAIAMAGWSLLRSRPKNPGAAVVLVSSPPTIAALPRPPVLVPIATTPPTTRPAAIAPLPVTLSHPQPDVRSMWNKALEAESRRDFATAFKIYKQIQQQPAQSWPTGLQTRLELARREMTTGTN